MPFKLKDEFGPQFITEFIRCPVLFLKLLFNGVLNHRCFHKDNAVGLEIGSWRMPGRAGMEFNGTTDIKDNEEKKQ